MRNYNDLDVEYTSGNLSIFSCTLSSLEGCPQHITGKFSCNDNKITSLVGGPQMVDSDYHCRNNLLTDLAGCASHIGGMLSCGGNSITSLVGIHKIIKSCSKIYFDSEKIKVGGIGLLLIDQVIDISSSSTPFVIIHKHLGSGTKGMMACRAELISCGYEEYAKL